MNLILRSASVGTLEATSLTVGSISQDKLFGFANPMVDPASGLTAVALTSDQ